MTLYSTDKLNNNNAATVAHALALLAVDPHQDFQAALDHAEQTVPLAYENERVSARRSLADEPPLSTLGDALRATPEQMQAQGEWAGHSHASAALRAREHDGQHPHLLKQAASPQELAERQDRRDRIALLSFFAVLTIYIIGMAVLTASGKIS